MVMWYLYILNKRRNLEEIKMGAFTFRRDQVTLEIILSKILRVYIQSVHQIKIT